MKTKNNPKITQSNKKTSNLEKSPHATAKKPPVQVSKQILDTKSIQSIKSALKIHAKALGIPSGSAEIFINKSITATEKSLATRKLVTKADFTRRLARELKKFHPDLAYVFENYAKII